MFTAVCGLLLLGAGCLAAQNADAPPPPPLSLAREKNWLIIRGSHLPGGEIRINYLEAYCRAGSTDADWMQHTYVGHRTELISSAPDGRQLHLRCKVNDGLVVDHHIRAGEDTVSFDLTVHNPTSRQNEAQWAQPCVRLGRFAGAETDALKEVNIKLSRSFIFLNGQLTRLPTLPWATEARYVPGQVWCPPEVPRTDVNPRPLSALVPSHGLIGCFSQDERWIFAMAFSPWQELFQGVAQCLHSDFRIGIVPPGESKTLRGKIYLVPNPKDEGASLLRRYEKDFPVKAE
jgi:hypothetical protein